MCKETVSGRENGTCDKQGGWSKGSKVEVVQDDTRKIGMSAMIWGLIGPVLF